MGGLGELIGRDGAKGELGEKLRSVLAARPCRPLALLRQPRILCGVHGRRRRDACYGTAGFYDAEKPASIRLGTADLGATGPFK